MPYRIIDQIHFLSEASKILSSSLDYNVTLAVIAKLVVSEFGDFCMIDLLTPNGKLERVASQTADQKKQKIAQKMFEFPSDPKNREAIYDTARTGNPILIGSLSPGWLKKASKIPEERRLIKKLGLRSFMFAPLKSRGNVIGVLTIVSNKPNFSYSNSDLALAEELAIRAGIAVDKAKLYQEAQDAIKMRDEFVSIASHELKTPLTSILLNLQLALERIKNATNKKADMDEIERLIEINITQSKRLSTLINDLLNTSVISSGKLKIEKEKVDLDRLICDIIEKQEVEFKKNKIKVIYKNKYKIIGNWDLIRIEQVLLNLISNAVKYGDKKPIKISVTEIADKAVIRISDEGIGINQEDQPYVFDLFRRAVNPSSYKGLGIGLFISRQIIEAHDGSLTLESIKNEGTTFTIELPI